MQDRKATGVFESYKPGDVFYTGASPDFLVDTSGVAKAAEIIKENCDQGPVLHGEGEIGKRNDPEAVLP